MGSIRRTVSDAEWLLLRNLTEPTSYDVRTAEEIASANGFAIAFARLIRDVELVAGLYREFGETQAVEAAVAVIVEFLNKVPILRSPAKLAPFLKLHSALIDIAVGVVPPLFETKKSPHRAVDPWATRAVRSYAAATMDLLMQLKFSKDEAAVAVHKKLRSLGIPVGNSRGGNSGGRTIARWRDRIKTGSRLKDSGTDIYYDLTTTLGRQYLAKVSNREAAKKALLRKLEDVCTALGTKKSA
jgi:hypothetical protein